MGDPNNPGFQNEFEIRQRNRESAKRFKESRSQEARQGQGRQQNGGNESGYESEHVGINGGANQVDYQHGVLDAIKEDFSVSLV